MLFAVFALILRCDSYMERDPIRGKDSFAAFEEMLLLAKQKKVNRSPVLQQYNETLLYDKNLGSIS